MSQRSSCWPGVEPLLEAPEASRNLLANWSMGSGGGEAEAQ